MYAMKRTLPLLPAVLALLATMAANAFAFHPLFLTASGKTLLVTVTSGLSLLRALKTGLSGVLSCEKFAGSGQILDRSTLVRKVQLEYKGKCVFIVGTSEIVCTEPIIFKTAFGELGLLTSTNKKVLLLFAPEQGTEYFKLQCGALGETTLAGAVVGEFPEFNGRLERQLNKDRKDFELIFASVNKSEAQAITEIFLLGTQMTKEELTISGGLLEGKASEEAIQTWTLDGEGLINTA